MYADFLDEAAILLERPGLREASERFRAAAAAWWALASALLPDEVEPLRETRELMLRRHHAFLERGNAAGEEMESIDARLQALKESIAGDFPLDAGQVEALRASIAVCVMTIHDIEGPAVEAMRIAMAG
jgi:hypothetical protein